MRTPARKRLPHSTQANSATWLRRRRRRRAAASGAQVATGLVVEFRPALRVECRPVSAPALAALQGLQAVDTSSATTARVSCRRDVRLAHSMTACMPAHGTCRGARSIRTVVAHRTAGCRVTGGPVARKRSASQVSIIPFDIRLAGEAAGSQLHTSSAIDLRRTRSVIVVRRPRGMYCHCLS